MAIDDVVGLPRFLIVCDDGIGGDDDADAESEADDADDDKDGDLLVGLLLS